MLTSLRMSRLLICDEMGFANAKVVRGVPWAFGWRSILSHPETALVRQRLQARTLTIGTNSNSGGIH